MYFQEPYLPLDENGQRVESPPSSTREFLMRCFLGARQEADRPSNDGGYDEDVNVYVVGLLERFLSPAYHQEIGEYLRRDDIALSREVRRHGDDRRTFQLYKTNADHLLLGIGLFHHVEGAHHPGVALADREPEWFIHRGGTYYHLASSSLRRLRRRSTGPELAMSKLGNAFAEYVDVLRRVRMSYFHLTSRLSDCSLLRMTDEGARDAQDTADAFDRFLDCYSAWKEASSLTSWRDLREAVAAIRELDPDFGFEMPDRPEETA